MRRSLIIVFVLLAFSLPSHAQAQEQKAGEEQTREMETESMPSANDEVAPAEEAAEAVEESQGSDENFIPTEKINVDSSVSFPVDI